MKEILSLLSKSNIIFVIAMLIITLNSSVTYANNKICYVYNGTVDSLVGKINNILIEKGKKDLCLTTSYVVALNETQSIYLVDKTGGNFNDTKVSFFHNDGKNIYKIVFF